jgi:hypothetical protein
MRHIKTGKKITRVRPAFGSIRHVWLEGDSQYTDARRSCVEFERPHDEYAWDVCGPDKRPDKRPEFVEV